MRRKKGEDINGWLIVDKPRDIGSTQVVNLTRRLFNAKKNGHAGTLDPFATGILPIAFGEATKLLPYVTDGRKEYEFVVQWGKATDTGDSEGKIVSESDKIPDREEILAVIPQFVGQINQVPPAYSAIKNQRPSGLCFGAQRRRSQHSRADGGSLCPGAAGGTAGRTGQIPGGMFERNLCAQSGSRFG